MKAFSKTLLLLAGMSLLLAGCQKEGRYDDDKGLIRFSAATRPGTKTVYSGVDVTEGTVTYERIDWKENDRIRIWSPEATDRYDLNHAADYKVVQVTPDGRRSTAKIVNASTEYPEDPGVPVPSAGENDNVNGLLWGAAGSYTFYGVYPAVAGTLTDGGFSFTGTIPAGQTLAAHTYTADKVIYEPDMNTAYMSAVSKVTTSTAGEGPSNGVTLEFDPLFTAFDVALTAETDVDEITITGFELVSDAEALAGPFTVSYAGTTRTVDCSSATDKVAGVSFPTGTTITPTKELHFTVFALPQDLTDLTLCFYVKDGDQTVTRSLKLTKNGSPIPFDGCKKHRIYGIAMPDGMWRFKLDPLVEEWDYIESNTSYAENVQAKAFSIEGAIESGNHYEAYDTGTNNDFKTFAEWDAMDAATQANYNASHATYYEKYYQLRTLDMSKQTPYFEIKFTPIAPYAGYWNLSAEAAPSFGNTSQGGPEDGFRIVLYDGETEQDDWDSGQIMNMEVVLRIYPKAGRDLSKEYCMLLTAFFSPNKNGEPTHSADSELQDVHGDGRYSYWKFVIPATQ